MKDGRLFPEGSFCEERDDRNITIGDHVREFFTSERADREAIMRHEFRVRSQLKHHLGNYVSKTLGSSRPDSEIERRSGPAR